MRAIQACSPVSTHFLEPDHLQPLADCYDLDCEGLRMEAVLAKCTVPMQKTMECTADVLKELSPLKEAILTLLKLLQIALTICVSTAFCDRSFSALKWIETYLQSTMLEERLVNLAVLSVEREISRDLCLENVVDKFHAVDKNRRILSLKVICILLAGFFKHLCTLC